MRTIGIIVIIIILAFVLWWVFGGAAAGAVSIDREECTLQQNDTYICPPGALSNFGPVSVTDTASGNECTISYSTSNGFSFDGTTIDTNVPPTDIAVSFLPDGSVSNIATTGTSGSIAMHVDEDGTPDHVLTVNIANQTEQCFNSE